MSMTKTKAEQVPVVKSIVMVVTPEMAEDWLGHNKRNRPLRNHSVELYAAAMRRGEWKLNGDAIRFDINGDILDGQHRLWAITESGVSIETFVVTNLPTEAQMTMDMGLRRNLSNHLCIEREVSWTTLAASLTVLWRRRSHQEMTTDRPSIPQAMDLLEKNPGMRDAVRMGSALGKQFRVSTAVAVCSYYEMNQIAPNDAQAFWDKLVNGTELEQGSPVLMLRRYLERQSYGTRQQNAAVMTHALFYKAWNAWRDGKLVGQLTWRPVGTRPEPFPEPR